MIYLFGGSGYVGQAYQRLLRAKGLSYKSFRRADMGGGDTSTLIALLKSGRPDFLINAAGYTGRPNVDACELHKAECLFANVVLPGRIAEACDAVGVPWGHVSSGCIYSGAGPTGHGFKENDAPNFTFRAPKCSFYSGTKALGEDLLAGHPGVYIWRLRIPFEPVDNPRNYLSKLMHYEKLLDVTNSLSELSEFTVATLACWEKRVPFGTYNVTNPGHVTTREVVDLIQQSRVCPKKFAFFASEDEFMHVAAKTPRSSCVLDSSKLADAGITMTEIHEAIRRDLRQWQKSA